METATLEGMEMKSYTVSGIVERKATEAGALDGFECKCSCGLVMRSSLRSLLEQDVAAHAAYHTRRGDVVDQGAYEVKCDECKTTLRRTDSVAESAAGGTCDECRRAARVENVYVDLKLRDRLTPGRTPWQTLRKRAEAIVEQEQAIAGVPEHPTHVLVDVVEGRHHGLEGRFGLERYAELVSAARAELARRAAA